MNNVSRLLFVSVVVLGLAACVTKPAPECSFPSTRDEAPLWVCDRPIEGMIVSSVGSAQKTAAGYDFMRQMAAAAARVQLAQTMKVQVKNMVKQYAETTGVGKTGALDQVFTSVSKQITSETLVGSKIFRTAQAPDGTLYVLVGLDEETVISVTQAVVKSSMAQDPEMWEMLNAKPTQTDLASEIAKQKVVNQ